MHCVGFDQCNPGECRERIGALVERSLEGKAGMDAYRGSRRQRVGENRRRHPQGRKYELDVKRTVKLHRWKGDQDEERRRQEEDMKDVNEEGSTARREGGR